MIGCEHGDNVLEGCSCEVEDDRHEVKPLYPDLIRLQRITGCAPELAIKRAADLLEACAKLLPGEDARTTLESALLLDPEDQAADLILAKLARHWLPMMLDLAEREFQMPIELREEYLDTIEEAAEELYSYRQSSVLDTAAGAILRVRRSIGELR